MESQTKESRVGIFAHECERCRSVFSGNIKQLRRDAESQCPISCIRLAGFEWAVAKLSQKADSGYFQYCGPSHLIAYNDHGSFILENFELDEGSRAAGNVLPRSTASSSTMSAIKSWLDQCITKHQECALYVSNASTIRKSGIRFLEIQEDRVLLIENMSPVRYACLSHCWGSSENVLQTTTSNLYAHLEEGIRLSILPATFRDAVEVCRSLGIFHLWIDSLCIIQDSDDDWRGQSAKMADIYANAIITVAASASASATEGCFRITDPTYKGEPLPGHPGVYVRFEPWTERVVWPLLTRAWVFQELTISPRVVHFGTQEVVWQCQHAVRSEGRQSVETILPSYSIQDLGTITNIARLLQSKSPHPFNRWHQIVKTYSYRQLTYFKDRLPAIAAMAKRMHSLRPNDKYLAGLWQSNLCSDLLWYNVQGSSVDTGDILSAVEQRIVGGVPTWSWASIDAEVAWERVDKVLSSVDILKVDYSVRGPAVSGDIIEAAITLRGPLMSYHCIRNRHKVPLSLEEASSEGMSTIASELTYDFQYWDDWGYDCDEQSKLFLLFLAVSFDSRWYLPGQPALIIKETDHPGRYVRLGRVTIHFAGWFAIFHERVEDFPEKKRHQKRYNSRFVAMLEGMGTQTVTLVSIFALLSATWNTTSDGFESIN